MTNSYESRAAARAALEAYRSHQGLGGNGDETDTTDLVADLLHLADTFTGDDETSGSYLAEQAVGHYGEELADEVVDYDDDENLIEVDDELERWGPPPGFTGPWAG